MDALNMEAIHEFKIAFESFLPVITEPTVEITLIISSLNLTPTGIGGFVGVNEETQGDILGRRIAASVAVVVKAEGVDALNAAVMEATVSLVGANRTVLAEQGILRITLDDVGPKMDGVADAIEQVLTFKVLYEFLKQPQDTEEIIQQIPINLEVN